MKELGYKGGEKITTLQVQKKKVTNKGKTCICECEWGKKKKEK